MGSRLGSLALTGFMLVSMMNGAVKADILRIGGTGAAMEPFRHIGAKFAAETRIRVEVLPSLGSAGGISAAADDVIQLAVSGRPATPGEAARGLTAVLEVCTPYVLASSNLAPGSLDRTAVAAIYAQDAPKWADGSAIKIILRPKAESDNATMAALFPGMERSISLARARASVPIGATDQDNADMAEKIPGSLIGGTYAQLITERRALRFVAIDGTSPDLDAYESGRYPFGKRLQLIVGLQPTPELGLFLDFLRSPAGAKAMRNAGIVPCPA